jgi:hypothetical protein
MKPWEDEKTVKLFQKMSANESMKYACDLIRFSLEILISIIKTEHPKWKEGQIRKEMEKILYEG